MIPPHPCTTIRYAIRGLTQAAADTLTTLGETLELALIATRPRRPR